MTNFERMLSMTKEEFAVLPKTKCFFCEYRDIVCKDKDCDEGVLTWLYKDVDESNNENKRS